MLSGCLLGSKTEEASEGNMDSAMSVQEPNCAELLDHDSNIQVQCDTHSAMDGISAHCPQTETSCRPTTAQDDR